MTRQFKRSFILSSPLLFIGLNICGWQVPSASAMGYGVYDARSLAMGGTGVAIGNSQQAAFYNPALLATGDDESESRTYMPSLVAQVSSAVDTATDAVNDNLDQKLSQAMLTFNSQVNMANAGRVAKLADEMRRLLDKIANRDLTAEAFVGVSASEKGEHEGGAFFIGVRTIGVATSDITPTDLDLLDQYIDAMGQISEGVAPVLVAALHPALISFNGQFSDPTTRLTSSADVSALVISEWGLALAKEISVWQQPVQIGLSPKLMRIDAYRDSVNFNTNSNNLDRHLDNFSETKTSLTAFNADLGAATLIAEHYRISFAIKDLVTRGLDVKQLAGPDLRVKLRPRSRMGLGYISDELNLSLDYDLQASTPIGRESHNRELRLGAEYKPLRQLALRIGYSRDLASPLAKPFSLGAGYQGKRFLADIAYSRSSDMKGASLQVGWTF